MRDYDRRIADTFCSIRRLPPFDAEKQLFQSDEFVSWRRSSESGLILLQGKTVAPNHTLLSWHSSATTTLVRDPGKYLATKGSKLQPVLYCFCQVSESWDENPPPLYSAHTVMSSIIYQLLKTESARPLLRDDKRYGKLKRDIEDLSAAPTLKFAEPPVKLYSMLASLLAELALERVFVVLDRVDRIQGHIENFLESLLELIEKSGCVLKVLVTMRTEHAFDDSIMESRENYVRIFLDQD